MSSVADQPVVRTGALRSSLRWGRGLAHLVSAPLLLAGFCGFLFFYGLTRGELYRTEGLRALLAAEVLRSGNWIVPTLYGEPLLTKPPGMYAAIAALSWPLGSVSELTARLPSALAATALVFLFHGCFRRSFGDAAGLVAALILPTSFMWLDKAPSAEIDMLQVAWVGGAILCFLRALEAAEDREAGLAAHASREWLWWLAALLCVAGGVLTKWTAPAFFYLTVVPLLAWRGRLRLLISGPHLVSLALCIAICLAWVLAAIALAGWPAFREAVAREGFMHLLPSHNPRPYPWLKVLAHPFKLLATNLPWSLFALLTLWPGFGQRWHAHGRRLLQAFHCWTWPNMFFWSIIPEHSTRHSFPLFPGLAGLAACLWIAWRSGRVRGWPWLRPGKWLLVMVLAWLAIKVAFVQVVIPARDRDRQPRAKGELLARLVPPDQTLSIFRLKDEGLMFYYGRPVRRLMTPAQVISSGEQGYCILDQAEWQQWQTSPAVQVVQPLCDEQGDPIVLVTIAAPRRRR